MKRNMAKAGVLFLSLMFLPVFLTGCGLFGNSSSSAPIDPPQVEPVNSDLVGGTGEGEKGQSGEVIMTDKVLYLFDSRGYVVPMTMKIPYSEAIAKQVLTYMVKGGPVEKNLPPGFSAVLPVGTTFQLNVKTEDGTAVVDFSKEFKNYEANEEEKILQAVTWALTEFPTIKQVKIRIEGKDVETMPVAGTPVNQPLTREDGINIEVADSAMPGNSTALTLYFEGETPDGSLQYFVPVTRLVPWTEDKTAATVAELIKGPLPGSGLVSNILPTTKVNQVKVDQGVALADFDEKILGVSEGGKEASIKGIQSVLLSLAATSGAEKVQILVNGKADPLKNLIDFSQPVAKPKSINPLQF
ncbi:GerMN domain-containing protein [Thermicanus aegyptius]|uniref:GerMN domain-containing protein n=1 Tax=Thermicanus aegyptius TaxID=94009 RepID=UPI00040080F7|nr:GerMN domain-containing protein [Thermicanus aegyptius]